MQGSRFLHIFLMSIVVIVPVVCFAGTYTVPCTDPFAFPLQAGWPIEVYGELDRSCVIADVDSDGKQEICFYPGYSGKTYLINSTGSDYNVNWPIELGSFVPSMADVDRNGDLEIFLGAYEPQLVHHTGVVLPNWPYELPGGYPLTSLKGAPLMVSEDDYSDFRIISGISNADYFYCWDKFGENCMNWPLDAPSCSYSPALIDLEGDGNLEYIFNITNKDRLCE